MSQPTEKSIQRIEKLVETFTKNSGTNKHPEPEVTQAVVLGLAKHLDTLGKPLCPCRFYPDKTEEIKNRTWICPCDDMQVYKYCHCPQVKTVRPPTLRVLPPRMMAGCLQVPQSRVQLPATERLRGVAVC